jgi:rare lipoprotein A
VEPRSAEPLPPETAAPAQAAAKAAPGFWLQLGAFGQAEGALQFQQRVAGEVAWLAPLLAVFSEQRLHRLQAGPYASRAQAQAAAQRLRDQLQLVPAVVERR